MKVVVGGGRGEGARSARGLVVVVAEWFLRRPLPVRGALGYKSSGRARVHVQCIVSPR